MSYTSKDIEYYKKILKGAIPLRKYKNTQLVNIEHSQDIFEKSRNQIGPPQNLNHSFPFPKNINNNNFVDKSKRKRKNSVDPSVLKYIRR